MSTATFIDRGGTFTDIVTIDDDGGVSTRKVRSDEAVVGELAKGRLTFGTTVATNALLERRVVRTLLLVTEGFEDLLQIRDMRRPELFDPRARWPAPLIADVVGIRGRMDAAGREVVPLELPSLELEPYDSVAIVLLHGPSNPTHELALERFCRDSGARHISVGHRCVPEVGYLARMETTVVDAAVTPILQRALHRDRIEQGAFAIRSDGSLTPAMQLRAPEAVLSGPAGGVLAVAAIAEAAGFTSAVGLDMGGTSTDVCRVDVGPGSQLPWREGLVEVAGVRVKRRVLEVETIAAGGGSILTTDGRRLQVGPKSAGAHPGPQCYGRGGPPTLTDAALAEGLMNPNAFEPPLDADAVDLPASASEYLAIARESMAQAVRKLATQRGINLKDHALVAYGGAAGQHAAEVAARLGIRTVLLHPCASVLSAFGQTLARREEEWVEACWGALDDPALNRLRRRAIDVTATLPDLGPGSDTLVTLELRYEGTDHALSLVVDHRTRWCAEDMGHRFAELHRRRFGFQRDLAIELVNLRVRGRAPKPTLPRVMEDTFDFGGTVVDGPMVVHSRLTSLWVPDGWRAFHDPNLGLVVVEQQESATSHLERAPEERTPFRVELWVNRFQSAAAEAGTVLARLARSVNIRERHDFSVAIFDGEGGLVANAPHIPVHLGAMGATVRDVIRQVGELQDGQSYLSNDPAAGGSHLPDLTVVTPVLADGYRFFVASRGHHVDVGGLTPGSMPPHSTTLADEGFVVRHVPLCIDGQVVLPEEALASRAPSIVLSDLCAQVAANRHVAAAVKRLGGPSVIAAWMKHLADVAAEAVAEVIGHLPAGIATDRLEGMPLSLSLRPSEEGLMVDFAGTGGPHKGNLNAPSAVVRAAALYSLRVLVGHPIPLNEGALRMVSFRIPQPSVLAPPRAAAVVGGNVETSQRLVDLFLRAAGACASSQGTMNNLTIGGENWAMYETIGGGAGAFPDQPGASGQQVHMTNTRATDPEVLEARLPLRLWRFSYRPRSGGHGKYCGGDGLVREIELLEQGTVALLATRRTTGARGEAGGHAGQVGFDECYVEGVWQPWDGHVRTLNPGGRVRVATPGGGGWGEP